MDTSKSWAVYSPSYILSSSSTKKKARCVALACCWPLRSVTPRRQTVTLPEKAMQSLKDDVT